MSDIVWWTLLPYWVGVLCTLVVRDAFGPVDRDRELR